MSLLGLILIALVVCWLRVMAGSLAALQTANFRRAASGRLPEVAPVAILEKARSSLDCSRRCQWPACCSYGYSQTARQCRLFSASHLGGFQAAEEFDFFVRCPAARIGDTCSTSGDCQTIANGECRYGTCQCVAGYHFYPGPGTCVTVCSHGYGNGFYKVKDHFIELNNLACDFSSLNETACVDFCLKHSGCRSFEMNGNNCCIHAVTALDVPSDYTYSLNKTYYQRNCA